MEFLFYHGSPAVAFLTYDRFFHSIQFCRWSRISYLPEVSDIPVVVIGAADTRK
jgi:hypothetical protein